MSLINQVLQSVELRQDNAGYEFWSAQVKPVLDDTSSTMRYGRLKHALFFLAALSVVSGLGAHFHVLERFSSHDAVDATLPDKTVMGHLLPKNITQPVSSPFAESPVEQMSLLDARPKLTRTLFSVWQSTLSSELATVQRSKAAATVSLKVQPSLPKSQQPAPQADETSVALSAESNDQPVIVSTLSPLPEADSEKIDRQADTKIVVTKQLRPGQEANQMVQRAIDHEQKGRMSEAVNVLRQTLDQYPQSQEARQLLVGYLFDTKQDQEALNLLLSAIKQYPEQAIFSKVLAKWQLGHGQAEAVISTLKPVASMLMQDAEFHWIVSMAYQKMGQHAAALPYFERANALRPNQPQWIIAYALSLEANGQNVQAIQQFQIAQGLPLSERLSEFVTQRLHQLGSAVGECLQRC